MRGVGRPIIAMAAVALGLSLAGCTAAGAPAVAPTQTAWALQPTVGATGNGSPVSPKGTAAQNQAAFDHTIQGVLAGNPKATGPAVVAALESAGFPKSTLQYSAAKTTANLAAGSVMVSAQLGSSCLIGQWGAAVGGYYSTIAPALSSGGCLVGGGGRGTPPPTGAPQLGD